MAKSNRTSDVKYGHRVLNLLDHAKLFLDLNHLCTSL